MRASPSQNKAGLQAPALFSFITLRNESSGGILFNPFLSLELELDETETLIAGMFTGHYTLEAINAKCCKLFTLDKESGMRKVESTIEKLNRVNAFRFVPKKTTAPARPKQSVSVTGSSAYFSAPKNIIWDITYECNLKCPHCLTASGRKQSTELDTREALLLIDKLAEAKVLTLSLTGGEPFMRKDILQLLEHLATTGIRVDIASNGFHVPHSIIKALRNLPVFQIQVSIDGIGEEHDRFRGRKNAFKPKFPG